MTEPDPSPTPSPAAELLRQGLLALRREEFPRALEEFETALAVDPMAADVYAYRSGAMLALGRPLDAQADVARALELDSTSFAVNQKAGELSLRLGDLQSAADYFLAAVRAARPGSGDQHAATAALGMARLRQKTSISHHARLPGRARLTGLAGRSPRWLAARPRWLAARARREPRGSVSS